MRRQIAVAICSALLGFVTLSSHAMAQQKTAKECREEWRANKAANQANGVTEKAYVAQCRGGAAPAQTTAAPPTPPAPAAAPEAAATGQKTAKECREEWRANKAANQANGVTEKAYVAQCRGGAAPAQTTAAPPTPPAPAAAPEAAATGQKTAKECREEWRANKAANQSNGVTEKAYVAQCRGGAAPAQTTAAPQRRRLLPPRRRRRLRLLLLLLLYQRQPLHRPERLRHPRTQGPLLAFQKMRWGRTSSQPKLRLRPAAPPILLYGSI